MTHIWLKTIQIDMIIHVQKSNKFHINPVFKAPLMLEMCSVGTKEISTESGTTGDVSGCLVSS